MGLEAECETHGRLAVPARPQLAPHLLASQAAARARLLRRARPGATLIDGTRPPNPTRLTSFSHTRTRLCRPQLGCSCATAPSLCAHSPSLCAHSCLPACPQLPPDSSLAQPIAQPIAQPVPTRHTAPHHTPPVACPSAAASPRRATVAPDPRCARPARRGDRRAAVAPAPRAGRRCGHRRGRRHGIRCDRPRVRAEHSAGQPRRRGGEGPGLDGPREIGRPTGRAWGRF